MLFPKKTKFKKQFKGLIKKKTYRSNKIIFGTYALKALEETRLTSKQIESAKNSISKKMKKIGFIWVRIFPDVPVTLKPIEIRMGKGKGSVSLWVSKIRKGQILYEIGGISLKNAQTALKTGSNKLPIKTKFVTGL